MKIQGEHRFTAPRQQVWAALLDPEVLSRTVPGSHGLERTGDNEFKGELTMKIGPVSGVFQGKVALENLDPPNGYTLKLDGRGAPGFVNGSGAIRLEDDPSGGTLLHYDVDAQVGGRIAGVGQRLLDSSAKVVTRQALEALDVQIQARTARDGSASSSTPTGGDGNPGASDPRSLSSAPPPPSTLEFTAGVVKGVIVDMVPPQHRKKAGILGILAALLALVFGVRSLRNRWIARRRRDDLDDDDDYDGQATEFGSDSRGPGRDR
jgi:carbon monoxide dehydrogenase subunit G